MAAGAPCADIEYCIVKTVINALKLLMTSNYTISMKIPRKDIWNPRKSCRKVRNCVE